MSADRILNRRRFLTALAGVAGLGAIWKLYAGKGSMSTGRAALRHNADRLPPGQHWIGGLVEYSAGGRPRIDQAAWKIRVDGLVKRPLEFTSEEFRALPHVDEVRDFHCVTTWSVRDCRWRGVRLADLLKTAGPKPGAAHVFAECYGGYSTNFPLAIALMPDVLLADEYQREPLDLKFGGPVRLVAPRLYAYKSAKWVNRITLLSQEMLGYWERLGYSNHADPWREQRWSRDDLQKA